ncbi:MAG: gliding motility-associated C-terminal domain-containing protein, partial [Bacteroidota bacterium]
SSNTFTTNSLSDNDTVMALVTDANGCQSPNPQELIINIEPIPNAFSPNNDGINEVFLKGMDIIVFDRWGLELFRGNGGWDGTFKGGNCAAGTYFFVLKLYDLNNNVINTLKGTLTLLRNK